MDVIAAKSQYCDVTPALIYKCMYFREAQVLIEERALDIARHPPNNAILVTADLFK